MKQHISVEQLKELKKEQFIKLYRLVRIDKKINDERIANFYLSILDGYGFGPNKLLSEINIGKMIEMLPIKAINTITGIWHDDDTMKAWWQIYLKGQVCPFEELELCDALWQAIKYVLDEVK